MAGKAPALSCEFIGSFPSTDLLPKDRRPHVAVAGRSNVGKSSLLNRLVGNRKMAKVSATPGKTRALNFFRVNDRFYLVDLPGYGYAKVPKPIRESWGRLIEEYLTHDDRLLGLILLLDSRRDVTDNDLDLIEWLAARRLPIMIVLTKTDKLKRDQVNRKVRAVETQLDLPVIAFSTVTGTGKRELVASVLDLVDSHPRQ